MKELMDFEIDVNYIFSSTLTLLAQSNDIPKDAINERILLSLLHLTAGNKHTITNIIRK